MQHPPQMAPPMPSYPPANITSDQIQKYLDENKKLILAILDNQNLGKLNECAQYQVQLQKNLMYLAAIADAQPQTPTVPAQVAPHPAMQTGGVYMQHPQAMAQQQPGGGMLFPQKGPLQFSSPQQMQEYALQHQQQQQQMQQLQMQHQQAMQGQQISMRPGAPNNAMYFQQQQQQTEATLGGGTPSMPPRAAAGGPNDARGGNKQSSDAGTAAGSGGGGDGGAGDGEASRAKGGEESNK